MNVMSPLNTKELLQQEMVRALSALRNNKDILLTVLEVFVKEPHLDWSALFSFSPFVPCD
jgi:phosphatidylinositol kinase/protein kinase (PI-3  family)